MVVSSSLSSIILKLILVSHFLSLQLLNAFSTSFMLFKYRRINISCCQNIQKTNIHSIRIPSNEVEDENDISWGGIDIPTYNDYKEKLNNIANLSLLSNHATLMIDATKNDDDSKTENSNNQFKAWEMAQTIFDEMYDNYITEEEEDLEPTTEIYNLLLGIYVNSNDVRSKANEGVEMAEQILTRMQDNYSSYGVANPDVVSYNIVMKGWAKLGNVAKTTSIFKTLHHQHNKHQDPHLKPNVDSYNYLLQSLSKSGDSAASDKSLSLLKTMKEPLPDTMSFYHVMSCFARGTEIGQSNHVLTKIEDLIETMIEQQNSGNVNLNCKNTKIQNILIKVLVESKQKANIQKAENILNDMIESYKVNRIMEERPDAATFINVIKGCSFLDCGKALTLLKLLNDLYNEETKLGVDNSNIKPDNRVYNAVMGSYMKSRRDTQKAQKVKLLLDEMIQRRYENNDIDFAPNIRSFNNVLNACAFTNGNKEESLKAFQVAVDTFNLLRSTEGVEANHVTYGMFLNACDKLLPKSPKRDRIVEGVFRKCIQDGLVSKYVLDTLTNIISDDLSNKIFGGDVTNPEGIQIPEQWYRNLSIDSIQT